jgi:7-carboxy-7-deazaguanine synthase
MHAVLPEEVRKNATYMEPQEIRGALNELPKSPWVTFSGGDPMMWDLNDLIDLLKADGYKINIETQGDMYQSWAQKADLLTLSPKPPSAGPQDGNPAYEVINTLLRDRTSKAKKLETILKVVVFDELDLEFARHMHQQYPDVPFYISTGTPHPSPLKGDALRCAVTDKFRWITEEALQFDELADVTILPQVHVIAWAEALEV